MKRLRKLLSAKWWLEDYGLRIVFILATAVIIYFVFPMAKDDILQNPLLSLVFIMGMCSLGAIVTFVYVLIVYFIKEVIISAVKK